ncbi:MAG: hypothetical protein QF486_00185 [Candidatus Woesearchaeota archaeon]|jgi:plastocyanin/LysM repeat protein|nr:hypothetical protein [Candidatus Woesearchaeota archaeon]MDP7198023.1 hypothetical protein [Candidatus Woesearchaeota archaeon]MDP7466857.1 hypothetical protein [Candidatus Woesearchaeota archaeon]MDP7647293.1 hypothetical protein [Candidatus Woesearchaeota archaeon]
MGQLEDYVKEQLKAGYTKEQIQSLLAAYYPPEAINKALKTSHTGLFIALPLIIMLIIGMGVTTLIFVKTPDAASFPLTVSASVEPRSVVQNGDFVASITVEDGITTKHPINLLIKVVDETGKIIFEQKDFIVAAGKGSRQKPAKAFMPPGRYSVLVEASNKEETASITTSFVVTGAKAAPRPPPTALPPRPRPKEPEKQASGVTVSAPKACTSDSCISQLAAVQDDTTVCDQITSSDGKDSCLSYFFLHGDFSVCAVLKNPEIQQSCMALKQFADPDEVDVIVDDLVEEVIKDVSILDDGFAPDPVEIVAPTTVIWTNDAESDQDVVGDDFQSQTLEPGDPFSFVFTDPGEYTYESTFGEFTGTVSVS